MDYGQVKIELKGSIYSIEEVLDWLETFEKKKNDLDLDIGLVMEFDERDYEPYDIQTPEERNNFHGQRKLSEL